MTANPYTDHAYRVAIGPALERKIPYDDPYWPTFNASFVNKELSQVGIAAAINDGHAFTTWHRNRWRHSENFEMGQHLGVDFDTEDAQSSLPHLCRDRFVAKYAALAYTTPSHTPDRPRARVLFLLDVPIHQTKNYALASSALLWVFGTADRQCKDPARFWYGGRPGACEMEWIGNELPLDLVKDLISRYQEAEERVRRRRVQYEPGNADERDVVDALKRIDAWGIGYEEWLAVLMAIHSEFPGTNGEALADAWAQGRDGEVAQKWRSFDGTGNISGRVGIGTLFAMAKERGWER